MIDARINRRARIRPTAGELAAHNLMVILRLSMRNGAMLEARLWSLARAPGTVIHPEKRAAFSRRWLGRLIREQRAEIDKALAMVALESL